MLFPENIEEKIGFDRIRDALAQRCQCANGRNLAVSMRFMSRAEPLRRGLDQVDQMQSLLQNADDRPPLSPVDAFLYLKDVTVPGSFLESSQLRDLANGLEAARDWQVFLKKHRDVAPAVFQLIDGLEQAPEIVVHIRARIDDDGDIKDNATPELARIRAGLVSEKVRARKTLEKIMQSSRKAGNSPEDGSIAVRNGRLVIPVKAQFKRVVKGFIHDESASGNVVYIEPADVLEINNLLRELEYREKREMIRILTDLTDEVRPAIPDFEKLHTALGTIDFIHAKAQWGNAAHAHVPKLAGKPMLQWQRAYHPLLRASLEKQQRTTVPLDIRLDDGQRIIVISGPNAGGKSVCLKTVGLLQYMLQCGLPVPVAEGSQAGIFSDIFIDIGDEQSIDNDLSTYSSHLQNMARFETHCSGQSLFLIDEFGSGTDPHFGGAIAEAILDQLRASGARGVVTTHYTNLKQYAEATDGIVNGRMRFDVQKMTPLYQLETGRPGSSFSLEIASKTGLSRQTLRAARDKIGTDQLEIDALLHDLENEKKYYEEQARKADEKNRLLEKTLANYRELKDTLEDRKAQILNKAREEARTIVDRTNREIENLVRAIVEANAEKALTKQKRKELDALRRQLQTDEKKEQRGPGVNVIVGRISAGDRVRIKGTSTVGEVLSLKKHHALVAFGSVKSQVKLQRLEKITGDVPDAESASVPSGSQGSFKLNRQNTQLRHELDLRGQRGEAALPVLEKFIDDAMMFSLGEVRIIHGKGEGILRRLVRDTLARHPGVQSVQDEHADRGGAGVSVVQLQ